jgi:hypothetical protein
MTQKKARKITKYILSWLEYLDGRGIIFIDPAFAKKELKSAEVFGYSILERIMKDK